jgi:NADPH:quinone reductase-like Zn-dependent oxidoreductase
MKAIVRTAYGPPDAVLRLEEIEKPVPTEDRVLIQVHAASLNAADYRPIRGRPIPLRLLTGGLLKPKDPLTGTDMAGRVAAVGEAVERFRPGDAVFGGAHGAFAEYALAREKNLALKPANRSFEEAAAVPVAGLTVVQGFRYAGGVRPGQQVLIQGASGGVGTLALQLAKSFGAEVTAVCSPRNLDMARSLGADRVIDYTREDFTRNPERYDLIFAVNGYHPITAYKRALKPQGVYVCAGGTLPQFLQAMLFGSRMSEAGGRRLGSMGIAKFNREDMETLGELLAAGEIVPSVDRVYPLGETAAAFRYIEETHAQGKVVIAVEQDYV